MKKYLLVSLSLLILLDLSAQVAITTDGSQPHASAMLDVKSTNRGFLMPRVTLRTNVSAPATGLMVYETNTNAVLVYNGSGWVQLGSGSGSSPWLVNGTHIYNMNTGNVGIGTTTPGTKLHLAGGDMRMDGTNPTLQMQQSGEDKGFLQLTGNSLRLGTNSSNGAGKIIFRAFGNDHVFIDSIGQLGIGKSVPQFDLDVNGNARIQSTSGYKRSTLSIYANPNYIPDAYGPAGVTFFNYSSLGGNNYDYTAKYRVEMDGGALERLKLYHVAGCHRW